MRRPLFGTGKPRNILPGAAETLVFNTADLNQNAVYALTLFLWVPKVPTPDASILPELTVSIKDNGTALVAPIVSLSHDFLETKVGSVVKLLDKMPLSGQQAVYVQNTAVAPAGSQCFVYGYFEEGGVHEITMPFRGLDKPGAFVPPFVFEPTVLKGNAFQTALVHRFDGSNFKYIDVVNVDVTFHSGAAEDVAVLSVNASNDLDVILLSVGESIEEPVRIFPGIPFRYENTGVIQLGSGGNADTVAAAWGSFRRV